MTRIRFGELLARVADPAVSEDALRAYFLDGPPIPGQPTMPALRLNPAQVGFPDASELTPGMNVVAAVATAFRKRRQTLFNAQRGGGRPQTVILCEGDGWLHYPLFSSDVSDHLGADYAVCSAPYGGDLLADGGAVHSLVQRLGAMKRERTDDVQAVILSAGGTALAGLELPDDDDPAYEQALQAGIAGIVARYRVVLAQINAGSPDLRIFVHGYAYPYPLSTALHRRQVRLIDAFHEALCRMATDPSLRHVHVVDLRRVVWHHWRAPMRLDEMGVHRVASCFREALMAQGITPSRYFGGTEGQAAAGDWRDPVGGAPFPGDWRSDVTQPGVRTLPPFYHFGGF